MQFLPGWEGGLQWYAHGSLFATSGWYLSSALVYLAWSYLEPLSMTLNSSLLRSFCSTCPTRCLSLAFSTLWQDLLLRAPYLFPLLITCPSDYTTLITTTFLHLLPISSLVCTCTNKGVSINDLFLKPTWHYSLEVSLKDSKIFFMKFLWFLSN